MIEYSTLEKYDPQGMHKIYDRWPEIARESFQTNQDSIDFNNVDHIVLVGMGGSGAISDMFSAILSKTKVHVCVVKGYLLPKTVDSNTLVVATSISGDTIETLTVLNSARKARCKIIAFSSGGKMQDYCNKNKIEYRKIPQIHSPRVSFTGFLYSMLNVLESVVPLKKEDILESITQLEGLRNKISSSNLNEKNSSLNLADWITHIPLIYFPWGLHVAAIRFKNSLQENAKLHGMAEDVIEASHNGIVSWSMASNIQPILIRGKDDYIKTKERWEIIKEFFEVNKIDFREINSIEGSILSKIINLIYFFDYVSIYRAVLSKIDPSPVEPIDFIKNRL